MRKWLRQLDSVLRGEATRMSSLKEARIDIPVGGLVVVTALLGVIYGLCMGSFAMIRTGGQAWQQLLASAVKLPLLFFLTLAVTFPSLYVFNALIGARLSIVSAFRLLIAAMGVMLAVMASLGPIVVFFAVSTTSYPFMVLLNVAMGTIAGLLGLAFLLRTMHRLLLAQEFLEWSPAAPVPEQEQPDADPPLGEGAEQPPAGPAPPPLPARGPAEALDLVGLSTSRKARSLFRIWTIVFALVGAQMSWVLRPFIGDPNRPFQLFRERESNFFLAVLGALRNLFTS
ncbi:MAG TPA: hypothetical protein VFJ30_18860 [Phycisphaerae bacterium]|nr:hypothetical protein [Phycisphaerae bacterium]